MNSIASTDLKGESAEKLEGSLKSEEWFDAENHPQAKLVFTSVVSQDVGLYNVTGDFTIKGKTNPATFKLQVNNLLTNGDFENGSDSWIVGVDDSSSAPVVTDGGNTYYSGNVTNANPSEPYLVNVSQKLEIVQGNTYTLTFDAWSDVERSIIGGIGLSGGDFSNDSKSVDITTTKTNYTLSVSSETFGATDARVLFDLNGENGLVNIDNVVLTIN